MSVYGRARPAPSSIAEACEIAAPLAADVRLRDEEREAIEMLVRELRRGKPTRNWIDPREDDA